MIMDMNKDKETLLEDQSDEMAPLFFNSRDMHSIL